MSDLRQQSYYEIALTNRQVVIVFIVLLVCVLAAFFGGVWVGRGDGPMVATVEPQAISSGVAPGDEPLTQVGFFGDSAAATDAALAEDGSGDAGPDVTASPGPSQPVIIEELRREPPREAELAPAPARESATVEPERTTGPVEVISSAEIAEEPVPTGDLVVQVFSSTDRSQAERVLERLKTGGYQALLSPLDSGGRMMYRVRVGPFSDREAAQTVAERIRRTYKLDTWITR